MRLTYRIWCDVNMTWTEGHGTKIGPTEDPREIARRINEIHETCLNDGPLLDGPEYEVTRASGTETCGVAWLEGGRGHDSVIEWRATP